VLCLPGSGQFLKIFLGILYLKAAKKQAEKGSKHSENLFFNVLNPNTVK